MFAESNFFGSKLSVQFKKKKLILHTQKSSTSFSSPSVR